MITSLMEAAPPMPSVAVLILATAYSLRVGGPEAREWVKLWRERDRP